jgi:hypothetical protein
MVSGKNFRPFTDSCLSRTEHIRWATRFFRALQDGGSELVTDQELVGSSVMVRKVNFEEVQVLTSRCRCSCKNWSLIYLKIHDHESLLEGGVESESFQNKVITCLENEVSNCRFVGIVVLGLSLQHALSEESEELQSVNDIDMEILPTGVHNNQVIKNCIMEPASRVHNNTLLENTWVQSHATVHACGHIQRTRTNDSEGTKSIQEYKNFASSLSINVGPEGGGSRTVLSYPESTLVDAACQMKLTEHSHSETSTEKLRREMYHVASLEATSCPLNIVSSHANISFTSSVQDVYLSAHSAIEHAAYVHNVTLLPHAVIQNSASAVGVQLQWYANISSKASVSDTLLMEHSTISTSGTVTSSIVGPDCHTSCGEVHHCLLGPHVNAHHQSLLIATVWYTGRGNVGYGANVGSNHTGRAADQECWAGEGTFWGLSCIIQFPVNLTQCPYSLVAAGVQMRPFSGVPCLPFSLFLKDGNVLPGWVLQHSPYTIARAEQKYATRSKAKRHFFYTQWEIQRPGIVDLCVRARAALQAVLDLDDDNDRHYFAEHGAEISPKALKCGIEVYTNFIQRYALRGLWERVQFFRKKIVSSSVDPGNNDGDGLEAIVQTNAFQDWMSKSMEEARAPVLSSTTLPCQHQHNIVNHSLPWDELPSARFDGRHQHQGKILMLEFWKDQLPDDWMPCPSKISAWLALLVTLEEEHSARVELSKKKDDVRGDRVISSYASHHTMAEDDKVVKEVLSRFQDLKLSIQHLVSKE